MVSKEFLKQILTEQREAILNKPTGVTRTLLPKIKSYKRLPQVIVITGMRRVGKSTFLRQIIKEYYADKDFYYINFEDERLFNFPSENFNNIYEALIELFGEKTTFFIDEIQNVQNFEIFVRRFYEAGFKFFITGSSANLLSMELGSKLTGRHLDVTIFPFSFFEFLKLKNYDFNKNKFYKTTEKAKIKNLFGNYLLSGGMPEYLLYNEDEILTRIYEDIVIKDIAVRYGVLNFFQMKELFQYLISNFACKISFTKLTKIIGIGSINTVKAYVNYLVETYFISLVNKFDFSYKKQLINNKKIYVIDNGFIPLISTRMTKDKGWLLENLVFNEFNKQFEVFYFSNNRNECDFVIRENRRIKTVVQVCWELTEENKEREMSGLSAAMDFFKIKSGLIITNDQEEILKIDNKTISVTPVWKWLLESV